MAGVHWVALSTPLFQEHLQTNPTESSNNLDLKQTLQWYPAEEITQPIFTCSKLTMKTVEQGVKYIQS